MGEDLNHPRYRKYELCVPVIRKAGQTSWPVSSFLTLGCNSLRSLAWTMYKEHQNEADGMTGKSKPYVCFGVHSYSQGVYLSDFWLYIHGCYRLERLPWQLGTLPRKYRRLSDLLEN